MKRWIVIALIAAGLLVLPQFLFDSETYALTASVAAVCLLLWISEVVPPFVPTLFLWAAIPLLLSPIDHKFSLQNVLSWAADPVMALFFGGFVLGVAAEQSGIASRVVGLALRTAGTSYRRFLFLVVLVTAFLSMWISNIAAAALVLACLHQVLCGFDDDNILRRLLLVGVALGADFGGIATPIGTGPNAIAIASISHIQAVSFLSWMSFALPLTVGMLIASYFVLSRRIPAVVTEWQPADVRNDTKAADVPDPRRKAGAVRFAVILSLTVALWLTEPLHKLPSAVVSLGAAFVVFLTGVLKKKDLVRIDWSTLLLIAGGITLGRLLEQSGSVSELSRRIPFENFDPTLTLFLLCLTSAVLSGLMSNTATAVLLIPFAMVLVPSPSTAILIAVAASFGVPFMISTPPNAMAFGRGGVKFADLFWPGLILMILGCAIVSLTGRTVLKLAGIE
jgi:sodium-dependent dicarboxylate transporter 2/3/5